MRSLNPFSVNSFPSLKVKYTLRSDMLERLNEKPWSVVVDTAKGGIQAAIFSRKTFHGSPEDARKTPSDLKTGERVGSIHPAMTYAEKLQDPRWQEKRQLVLQRDRYMCRECSATNGLQVHHCLYEGGNPWDTPERFLISLCGFHHGQRQEQERHVYRAVALTLTTMSAEDLRKISITASEGGPEAAENVLAEVALAIGYSNREKREREKMAS